MSTSDVQQGTAETESEAYKWRVAQYEELGFSESESVALAKSTQAEYTGAGTEKSPKKEWHQPLDWKKVKRALDGGCSKELALQIFSTYGE